MPDLREQEYWTEIKSLADDLKDDAEKGEFGEGEEDSFEGGGFDFDNRRFG